MASIEKFPAHTAEAARPAISLYHRLIARTVGYDVFIAYRQSDARGYAKALHDALEKRRLVVFLDEADEDVGAKIEQFKRIACSARTLVVVVTENVYKSTYVRQEIEAYRDKRLRSWWRRPLSRMIPINVNQALSRPPKGDAVWQDLGASVFVPEDDAAVKEARPSAEVAERIARAGRFVQSTFVFALMLVFFAAAIAGALGAGIWQLREVNERRALVERRLGQARDEAAMLEDQARRLEAQNTELNQTNRTLQMEKKGLDDEVKNLERKGRELNAQIDVLSLQERSIRTRARALRELSVDPVLAYRLAERAEGLLSSAENREVMRRAISSTDLLYANAVAGCTVDDVSGSAALLRCDGGGRTSLRLLDLDRGALRRLPHPAGSAAWLVAHGASWRLLRVLNATENRRYQLFDIDGSPVGDLVLGRLLTPRDPRCSPTSAYVPSPGGAGVRWNLSTNERLTSARPTRERWDQGVFLACRTDGAWALNPIDALELVSPSGTIVEGSRTAASFDYIYTSASWSPSGRHLAVHVHQGGRIGVWDPSAASFVWLDPDGWVATAYAWSPSGRLLAFAGNTTHLLDATVEVTQAQTPVASRRIVHHASQPIRAIAFSPDERELALLDVTGKLALVDLSGTYVMREARHAEARQVWWAGDRIVTSSPKDVRVWTATTTPRVRWQFRSSMDRTFSPCAAAEASWTWHAAVFREQGKRSGVLVRELQTGRERTLEAPDDFCHAMAFSRDGRWLVLVASKTARVWRTDTWDVYSLPLETGDIQYIGLHEAAGGMVLHALGAGLSRNIKDNRLYDLRMDVVSGPRVVRRTHAESLPDSRCPAAASELTAGWRDALERPRYRSQGRWSCPGVGWEVRAWCRDEPLGARDCDHEFVPTDLRRVERFLDGFVWRPPPAFLDAIVGR
ncbi:TIR domain-containing protein [Sorangium sp. So ce341]|uniref:TIR domain-containing protein n=1 Tax=Sorangium sp. So ce341 TaxID=3133302 RepID=UPI003F6020B6